MHDGWSLPAPRLPERSIVALSALNMACSESQFGGLERRRWNPALRTKNTTPSSGSWLDRRFVDVRLGLARQDLDLGRLFRPMLDREHVITCQLEPRLR
jgi:hypothetical protein